MQLPLVIDIETSGLDPWHGRLLCVAWVLDGVAEVAAGGALPEHLLEALADPLRPVCSHSTFDPRFLLLAGYDVQGQFIDTKVMAHLINENTPFDLEWLTKHYCGITMDKRITRADNTVYFNTDEGRKLTMEDAWRAARDQVKKYCLRDAEALQALYDTLHGKLEAMVWLDEWEHEHVPFTNLLVEMECRGLPIDLTKVAQVKPVVQRMADEKEQECYDKLGYKFNINSWQQIAHVLFEKLWTQKDQLPIPEDVQETLRKPNLVAFLADELDVPKSGVASALVKQRRQELIDRISPPGFELQHAGRCWLNGYWTRRGLGLAKTPKNEKTGVPSTSTPDLMVAHAGNDFITTLVDYRKKQKVVSTYLNVYPDRTNAGRLRGHWNQTGTVTGRLSSSGPNLMNQPAHGPLGELVRSLFRGNLIIGDYSQLEPRLMAHFSEDPVLLDIYHNDRDIYIETAQYVFGKKVGKDAPERKVSKRLVLAAGYGAGSKTLAKWLCLDGFPTTVSEASGYLDELRRAWSGFFDWRDHVIEEARTKYYVKTLGGRYRRLKGELHAQGHKMRMRGERMAVNAIIQGTAADVLRRTMLVADKAFPELAMLAQVHDEVLWQYEPTFDPTYLLPQIQKVMETAHGFDLKVPLKFEPIVCSSWAEKSGVEIDLGWLDDDA